MISAQALDDNRLDWAGLHLDGLESTRLDCVGHDKTRLGWNGLDEKRLD